MTPSLRYRKIQPSRREKTTRSLRSLVIFWPVLSGSIIQYLRSVRHVLTQFSWSIIIEISLGSWLKNRYKSTPRRQLSSFQMAVPNVLKRLKRSMGKLVQMFTLFEHWWLKQDIATIKLKLGAFYDTPYFFAILNVSVSMTQLLI